MLGQTHLLGSHFQRQVAEGGAEARSAPKDSRFSYKQSSPFHSDQIILKCYFCEIDNWCKLMRMCREHVCDRVEIGLAV